MNPITLQIAVDPLIRMALAEDIPTEDISTEAVMPHACHGEVQLIAKQAGVIAGLDVFERVFQLLDPATVVHRAISDGAIVAPGQIVARVEGDIRILLSGERVALNLLQRMSGIATYTRAVASALEGTGTVLVDTRKTTPGMRVLEKEAVRIGGGRNHRYNLSDGVMLKDNHIAAAGGVRQAIEAARKRAPFVRKIEVEVETMDMVREAIETGADIIMLDNMTHDQMAEAIALIDGRAETEASGNVTLENIRTLADLGVDYISSGALTHSAPILDLSLKNLRALEERSHIHQVGA
ncbi:MAG: carboxylating nicotinate-nucleotide diphosphorylase [Collinsella sp.]|nr:carboxylating nicotinate-nucleotide diphosphorylase [Collinsella sp.]